MRDSWPSLCSVYDCLSPSSVVGCASSGSRRRMAVKSFLAFFSGAGPTSASGSTSSGCPSLGFSFGFPSSGFSAFFFGAAFPSPFLLAFALAFALGPSFLSSPALPFPLSLLLSFSSPVLTSSGFSSPGFSAFFFAAAFLP